MLARGRAMVSGFRTWPVRRAMMRVLRCQTLPVRSRAKALLTILAERGLTLTEVQRRRMIECADLATLDHWLKRALSAASVDGLLEP